MKTARFSLGAAAICVFAAAPALTFAQTSLVAMSQAAHVTMPHPIQVSTCNPQRNVTYNYAGYTPAFYPYGYGYGRYWGWPSVYGPTYYQYPVENEPTLGIDYVNVTSVVMKQIEFGLIVRGALVAEVKDVGTFSPGAEIKHKFGLNPNVFPIQTSYAKCVPLKITFEDGSHWKNPHLPAYKASMYGEPHQ
ncbi:MAG: hypothetical protein JO113_04120 [Candidatus Eremiobacteraeota bacterium]|nr:hypothetical protein [Candidatus Eremiobacteraeota bacterium]